MKKKLLLFIAFAVVLAGCTIKGPKPPPSANVGKILYYNYNKPDATNYFRSLYRAQATNEPAQRIVRNEIILELRTLINQNYAAYEVALRDDRSIKDIAANLSAMGLTAASTVAGGAATKTILSAIATGVLGANSEIDRQLFKSLTVEALTHEMRKLRTIQETNILGNLSKPTTDYPLDMALDDLNHLYQEGFVSRALQELVADAAASDKLAEANLAATRNRLNNLLNTNTLEIVHTNN